MICGEAVWVGQYAVEDLRKQGRKKFQRWLGKCSFDAQTLSVLIRANPWQECSRKTNAARPATRPHRS
jgi:hypothetical protein